MHRREKCESCILYQAHSYHNLSDYLKYIRKWYDAIRNSNNAFDPVSIFNS